MSESVKYVGLDYHQHSVQVCVMDKTGRTWVNRSCPNDAAKLSACVGEGAVRAAIEACNGSANLAEELIAKHRWSVALAHPSYVARLLTDLERVGYLPRVWLAPESIRDLRCLVTHRRTLVQLRAATKLRIRAMLRDRRIKNPDARPWTRAWMDWLKTGAPLASHPRRVMDPQIEQLEATVTKIRQAERRMEEATRSSSVCVRSKASRR